MERRLINNLVTYAFLAKKEVMENSFHIDNASKHAQYAVSLPIIFVSYILITYIQVLGSIKLLDNVFFLFAAVSIILWFVNRLTLNGEPLSLLESKFNSLPASKKSRLTILVYAVDVITFLLLISAIYHAKTLIVGV
jgi:hypothetical protein